MSADFFTDDTINFDATNTNEDPVAAFLAREKAEFEKIDNDDFISGEFKTTYGGPFDNNGISNGFEDDFGLETSSAVPVVSQSQTDSGGKDAYSAIYVADKLAQEPEKIRKWREEQRERLTKKDAEEELKKQEWRETAKKELEDWYKNRQAQLEKTHANNKVNNKAAEAEIVSQRDSLVSGQEWDRISRLCDFNPKANKNTKDVSRMRSILLQLKQQPLVRNAN